MSVVGIDIGNDTSCVALARKRGIDVLMNKESKRETPAVVSFGDKMRFIGTDGAAKHSMNPKNTPAQLKRLLGKKFKDPSVQEDLKRLPFAVSEGPDGGVLIHVMYCNERATFTTEQIVAMLIHDLKRIVEAEAAISVTDCCVGVPTYFVEAERYAMLNATFIAGVNCLRLLNENTATSIAYGIYKTDLPETEPVTVAFVDQGHSATQVSIVAFKRSGLQVRSHAWDRNLGGRDLSEVLYDYFAAEFKEKYKLDVNTNAKAAFKLRSAVEKVKKVLSANAESPLNVECLMDDIDFRSMITRDKFEELCQPLLERMDAPMRQALEFAGVSLDDIAAVELVGSSTRTPAVFRRVEAFFKKTPSRTLNSKEVVARGCALQCAMLSPVFRVREFEVIDITPYNIVFSWEKDGQMTQQTLFEKGSPFPSTKMLTFIRSAPFTITASYAEDPTIPPSFDRQLGSWTIGPFTLPPGADKAKIKVRIALNLHGLVAVEQAQAIEEEEVEEPAPAPAAAAAAAAAPAGAEAGPAPATDGPTPMDTEAAAANGTATTEPATVKKKRTKKIDVPVTSNKTAGYDRKQLERFFETECQMQAADKLQEETNDRKNALEAYMYDLRNKLYDSLGPYVRDQDKEKISAELSALEDWLYDEGEDQTKSVYVAKLEDLKKVGGPVQQRYIEDQTRPSLVEELRRMCEAYRASASHPSPAQAHITSDERATVAREADAALQWLNEKVALQSQLRKYDDPVLLSSDIAKKRDVVERVCKPIMTKPAPAPKPAPQPAPQPAPAAAADATAAAADGMDTDAPAAANAGQQQQQGEQMEL